MQGFTLVELIVVLAIIIVITTITITSQTSYNRSLILTNTTYSVALSIREAQSLGLSSRKFADKQNAGYGVNFKDTEQTMYRIFGDIVNTPTYSGCPTGLAGTPEGKPGNCLFDNNTEIFTTFNLNKGFRVIDFCGYRSDAVTPRGVCGTDVLWTGMNITFLRPNTEAIMTMVTSGGVAPLECAVIKVAAPGNTAQKCIVVTQTGQVSVPLVCPATPLASCP